MKKIRQMGITYDDVLLVPQKSRIISRSSVATNTKASRNIPIAIPFISSNVDTVTESTMAIAMAKLGGLGIIHRFMTIEREAQEVRRVKRAEGIVMEMPYTVHPNEKVKDVRPVLAANHISSAVVVDTKGKVIGLLTQRDMWFLDDENMLVSTLMTPAAKLITAKPSVTLPEARRLFRKHKVEKLPLLTKDGKLAGLITSRTVFNEIKHPLATIDKHERLRVGAAVGVVGDYKERAQELLKVGVDVIVVDIAHIHSDHGIKAIKDLRKICRSIDVITGNIATAEAARDLVRLDVDALKVGIGPGGICITRMVAGAGVPQLTAIMDVARIASRARVPLIADGGTNYPGDMAKALAAGASSVMITGWLAGTDESPGSIILRNGQKYKVHRGAASFSAVASRKINGVSGQISKELSEQALDAELQEIVPEGVESFVPYKGAARDVLHQLTGAVRSGMSYCNAKTVKELWKNSQFIQISAASFGESKQHNVEEM